MKNLRVVSLLVFVVVIGLASVSAQSAFGQGANKDPKRRDLPAVFLASLKEAQEDLSSNMDKVHRAYADWLKESPAHFKPRNVDSSVRKLERLDAEKDAAQGELRELELQEEILKLRRKHLTKRSDDLELQKKEGLRALADATEVAATRDYYLGEIERQEKLFEEVVKMLSEVNLMELYGDKPGNP